MIELLAVSAAFPVLFTTPGAGQGVFGKRGGSQSGSQSSPPRSGGGEERRSGGSVFDRKPSSGGSSQSSGSPWGNRGGSSQSGQSAPARPPSNNSGSSGGSLWGNRGGSSSGPATPNRPPSNNSSGGSIWGNRGGSSSGSAAPSRPPANNSQSGGSIWGNRGGSSQSGSSGSGWGSRPTSRPPTNQSGGSGLWGSRGGSTSQTGSGWGSRPSSQSSGGSLWGSRPSSRPSSTWSGHSNTTSGVWQRPRPNSSYPYSYPNIWNNGNWNYGSYYPYYDSYSPYYSPVIYPYYDPFASPRWSSVLYPYSFYSPTYYGGVVYGSPAYWRPYGGYGVNVASSGFSFGIGDFWGPSISFSIPSVVNQTTTIYTEGYDDRRDDTDLRRYEDADFASRPGVNLRSELWTYRGYRAANYAVGPWAGLYNLPGELLETKIRPSDLRDWDGIIPSAIPGESITELVERFSRAVRNGDVRSASGLISTRGDVDVLAHGSAYTVLSRDFDDMYFDGVLSPSATKFGVVSVRELRAGVAVATFAFDHPDDSGTPREVRHELLFVGERGGWKIRGLKIDGR